ncbi:MAG: MotA/TolQ/ExbB proton channel family protein [Candidatus Thiodiazotropha sp.]|jgi:biopolymer transport protein ExbB/TolQ
MNIALLEQLMYQIAGLLLMPVLLLLTILFLYSFFILGSFCMQAFQRKHNNTQYRLAIASLNKDLVSINQCDVKGYRLFSHFTNNKDQGFDDLQIFALKQLEKQRIVTRVAPMLGLIATMIPMGPALKSLADGNIQGISENLIVAFAAVIFGLVTASITFWTVSVKKRWYAVELNDLKTYLFNENGEH